MKTALGSGERIETDVLRDPSIILKYTPLLPFKHVKTLSQIREYLVPLLPIRPRHHNHPPPSKGIISYQFILQPNVTPIPHSTQYPSILPTSRLRLIQLLIPNLDIPSLTALVLQEREESRSQNSQHNDIAYHHVTLA